MSRNKDHFRKGKEQHEEGVNREPDEEHNSTQEEPSGGFCSGRWAVSTVTDCASHRFCAWLVKSINKHSLYTGESGYLMIPPFPVFRFMAQDIANVSPLESVWMSRAQWEVL